MFLFFTNKGKASEGFKKFDTCKEAVSYGKMHCGEFQVYSIALDLWYSF